MTNNFKDETNFTSPPTSPALWAPSPEGEGKRRFSFMTRSNSKEAEGFASVFLCFLRTRRKRFQRFFKKRTVSPCTPCWMFLHSIQLTILVRVKYSGQWLVRSVFARNKKLITEN